jgi:hypothetical protein
MEGSNGHENHAQREWTGRCGVSRLDPWRQELTAPVYPLREALVPGWVRYGNLRCAIGKRHCFQCTRLESLGGSDTLHCYRQYDLC